ncbi:MAG: hypothetical protein EB030_03735 [Actinobacteria bacterium]|nr:hypothetical protein [Actinomycetota bacterium]
MTLASKPPIKLSTNLSKLVAGEMKTVALAIDSQKSLKALTANLQKSQENFQIIGESWGVVASKLRHPSLNFLGLDSIVHSLESIESSSQMRALHAVLESNKAALKSITANRAFEKLVLASSYGASIFSKSVSDIINSSRPSNWKNTNMSLSLAADLGKLETLTTVYVLNPRVINRLVSCKSRSARRKVLLENKSGITKSCLSISESSDSALAPYLRSATNLYRKGEFAASQALVGNIIETLLQSFRFSPGNGERKRRSDKFQYETENRADLSFEHFVLLHSLVGAYTNWRPKDGDPVPVDFNRHATAHQIHKNQYNQVNALKGIMLCSALLVAEQGEEFYESC